MNASLTLDIDFLQLNVLIDDSTKAILCDFGLSHVKADATSRIANASGLAVIGSRNWMAPEKLLGGSLKKPCDIYAFGMTIFEVSLSLPPITNDLAEGCWRFSRMKFHWVGSVTPISFHL